MGRGDKKTKRGKIFMGSFGKLRPSKSSTAVKPAAPAKVMVAELVSVAVAEPAPKKKAAPRKSKSAGE